MRTKEEITKQLEEAVFVKDEIHPEGYKQSWRPLKPEIELLLDIRELLISVDKALHPTHHHRPERLE